MPPLRYHAVCEAEGKRVRFYRIFDAMRLDVGIEPYSGVCVDEVPPAARRVGVPYGCETTSAEQDITATAA